MSNVIQLYKGAKDAQDFAIKYLDYLSSLLKKLDTKAIAAFIEELEDARQKDRTVFIIGNGGSAATSSHMANDIGLDVFKKSGTAKPYRIMSLTDNVPVMTAIGNDDGYNNLFLYQLQIHYRPGDKLVVISASGNSPNLISAAQWVKQQGGSVLGLLGFDGGKLKDMCDVIILAETPKGEYGPVEDIHMILDHLIYTWIWRKKRQEITS